jgi:hypothetical protein
MDDKINAPLLTPEQVKQFAETYLSTMNQKYEYYYYYQSKKHNKDIMVNEYHLEPEPTPYVPKNEMIVLDSINPQVIQDLGEPEEKPYGLVSVREKA